MPVLEQYSLPAFVQDFVLGSPDDQQLKDRWSINVSGWIAQAMPAPPSYFYDPQATDIPEGTPAVPVQWGAFPGRLDQYYSANPPNQPANPNPLTQEQLYSLADFGFYSSGGNKTPFPPIPQVICPEANWSAGTKIFGPYGPRGWLDEYCEWSAARDSNNNLVRVDFACENPEYWNTLWKVSPGRVAEIFQATLNYDAPAERQVSVKPEDLYLFLDGKPVIDPETDAPVYNPLNKWNNSPVAVRAGDPSGFTGGAMHLTSTPNTLQTELGLAGAATVQYQPPQGTGNSNAQYLICCGSYGQEYRHSDPHIGQSVNQVVGGQFDAPNYYSLCLANPVGLYLQTPNNIGNFQFSARINPANLPPGAQAGDVYQVVRGAINVADPVAGNDFPGAMILHAICQIPSAWLAAYPDMTLADITLLNPQTRQFEPIRYAGQIANQFNVGLYARPLTASKPPLAPCANTGPATPGAPLQSMFFAQVWNGYYNNIETAPTGQLMSLASNSTFIAPQVPANGQTQAMVITCNKPTGLPTMAILLANGSGPDPAITVAVTAVSAINNYAVPGNSFPPSTPDAFAALSLDVTIAPGASPGLRTASITDQVGGTNSLAAAIYILAP